MKTRIVGLVVGLATGATAQIGGAGGGILRIGVGGGGSQPAQFQFQQAGTLGTLYGARGNVVYLNNELGSPVVSGRPFSATEVRSSLQTLGDGTEISSSSSTVLYRDSLGRTRQEPDSPNALLSAAGVKSPGIIRITDPVGRYTITLNPNNMVARRLPMASGAAEVTSSEIARKVEEAARPATVAAGGRGGRGGRGGAAVENPVVDEDLGPQSMNGVVATGTRHTLTIPQGTIGNNRDIHVVNERWYSPDLQMLVKSVNSDPRFGTDTYELTNISRDDPDPALFQIPAGYTVMDGAGRGQAGQQAVPVIATRPVNK
jgi:hypothetical protein